MKTIHEWTEYYDDYSESGTRHIALDRIGISDNTVMEWIYDNIDMAETYNGPGRFYRDSAYVKLNQTMAIVEQMFGRDC